VNARVAGAALLALAVGAAMVWAVLERPPVIAPLTLPSDQGLAHGGVENPVTAVLLNFRAFDTLLEVAVLLVAAVTALSSHRVRPLAPPDQRLAEPVLMALVRVIAPFMLLTACYLLWAGNHRPGGAFQAGAVLAASGVLLRLAGRLPAWATPGFTMRLGLAVGLLIFLIVAAGVMFGGVTLLDYPLDLAGGLILLIEAGLTISIGLTLAGLFLSAPVPGAHREDPS
jgi:multisubunit Na+/H+ antiporter MnhB subunit